jgi:type VI secretion system protein
MRTRSSLSLFERLDALADDAPPSRDERSREGSIKRHLSKLLNSRAGSVSIQPDYGLSDFNDVARDHPDLPAAVALQVTHLLRRYEPRLHNIGVTPHPSPDDPTGLHFTITADIVQANGDKVATTFDLSLGRGRRASFR